MTASSFISLLRESPVALTLLGVGTLYLVGLNPYPSPDKGDDLTYYFGAVSIANGQGFTIQGEWIEDWPPLQSALTALVMTISGNQGFIAGKLLNWCMVIVSLLLTARLLQQEKRHGPILTITVMALTPTSFVAGTMTQADFTALALSMGYFLLLNRLDRVPSWRLAVLIGLLLGAAALTRYQSVLLGIALVHVVVATLWRSKAGQKPARIRILAPMVSAIIGASCFLGWRAFVASREHVKMSNYEYLGNSIWGFDPVELATELLNFLTQHENIIGLVFGNRPILATIPAILIGGIVIYGFVHRIRTSGFRPTDSYVLVVVTLLAFYTYKDSRYGIPIAPFVLDYLVVGLVSLAKQLPPQRLLIASKVRNVLVAIWLAGLLSIDMVLLTQGYGHKFGPRLNWMLKDERDFIKGYYLDIYDACLHLRENRPTSVLATQKYYSSLAQYYSECSTFFPDMSPVGSYDYYLEVQPPAHIRSTMTKLMHGEHARPKKIAKHLHSPQRFGTVTLWKVKPMVSPRTPTRAEET